MTDEEKEEYRKKLVSDCKLYNHIDYDDDEEIIGIMIDTALEELQELILDFDQYNMTSRQRLLVMCFVKELYDNRDKYEKDGKSITSAVSSMLLKEIYKGGRS